MTDSMGEFFNLLEQKSGVITSAADRINELQGQLTDSKNELSEYIQKLNSLSDQNKKQQATITQLQSTIKDMKSGGSGSGGSGNLGAGTKDPGGHTRDGKLDVGDYVTLKAGHVYHESSWGKGNIGS